MIRSQFFCGIDTPGHFLYGLELDCREIGPIICLVDLGSKPGGLYLEFTVNCSENNSEIIKTDKNNGKLSENLYGTELGANLRPISKLPSNCVIEGRIDRLREDVGGDFDLSEYPPFKNSCS